jgi:hypothetical protein
MIKNLRCFCGQLYTLFSAPKKSLTARDPQLAALRFPAPRPERTAPTVPRQLDLVLDDVRLRGMTLAQRQPALRSLAHLLLDASGIATPEVGDDHA